MRKLLIAAIVFLMLVAGFSGEAVAFSDLWTLQNVHGKNLDKADFVLRYKFEEDYGRSWDDSDFEDRKNFLMGWYTVREEEARSEEERRKAEQQYYREMELAQREEKALEEERFKRLQEEAMEEKRVEEEQKKEFTKTVDEAKKKLDGLRTSDAGRSTTTRM